MARSHRVAALLVVVLTLITAGLGAVEPLLMKRIFDSLSPETLSLQSALVWSLVLAGLALGREGVQGLTNWLTWRTRLRIHYALLDATLERLHRLPFDYHRRQGVGAIMTRLERGIQGFVGAISEIAFNLIPSIAYLIIAIVLMIQLSVPLTGMVLLFVPLPAVIAALAAPTQIRREQTLLDAWARLYGRFNEVLSGLVTVRSFAMEDVEKRRFLEGVDSANRTVIRGVGYDTRVGVLQNTFIVAARVIAVGLGAYLVVEGQITVGTVVAFLAYVGGLFGPVQGLTGMYRTLQTATVSIDTVLSILDAQEHIGDPEDPVDPGRVRGDIEVNDVWFRYAPDKPPVLRGVSLSIRAGTTVALVGPSGSGKSTLTALIQRLYDPDSGAILVDGHDVRTLRQSAIRRQIGVVLQDPMLFNDTVARNIAYGRPAASRQEIERVAWLAHADGFVRNLPEGYDTFVGERGSRLSAGERQRIAIARALLTDPPIVILDEATSALDAETEALVQDALHTLLADRTAVVIAHRLSTVVAADWIAVLKHGEVLELGTHRALIERGGYYASLVRRQTRGLLV